MRVVATLAVLLPLATATVAAQPPPASQSSSAAPQPTTPPTPCANSATHRQFDFWVGNWDVFPWSAPGATGPQLGTNDITVIEGGCALEESWRASNGGSGRSYNWFDRNLQTWRQLWIDQNGGTLDYSSAEATDGKMIFRGWTLNQQRRRVEQRLTFTRYHADTVRQLFETSLDSGRTWASGFDGRYIRRAPRR